MNVFKKNTPNWKISELEEEIQNFSKIYKRRPIKENIHGMRFQHMLITYFILKKIKPSMVIESGVFKGQSTWLIERTLPNCKILSIDIDLSKREYISKRAEYSNIDFKDQNFSNIPNDTLVFFDDHVNHFERLQQAKFFNIKNIILEDNYEINEGDFYTFKHAFSGNGFNHKFTKLSLFKTFWIFLKNIVKKFINNKFYFSIDELKFRLRDQTPNINHFKNIEKNINIYFEFPNIADSINKKIDISKEEIASFNNITFINLK